MCNIPLYTFWEYDMNMSGNRDYNYKMDEAEMEIKLAEVSVPHPSEKFRELLEFAGLSQQPANKIAKILGISRTAYYDFMNAQNGISPDIAIRLARFFYDFDGFSFKDAANPHYWWYINSNWIFYDWIRNPKNRNKKNNVGLKRFKLDENKNVSTVEDSRDLKINDNISLSFKPVN